MGKLLLATRGMAGASSGVGVGDNSWNQTMMNQNTAIIRL